MTDRYERAATDPKSRYRRGGRTTLWLAAIPMLLISLIGLVGGHALSGNDQAGAGPGPKSPDDHAPVDTTPATQMARLDALIERMTHTPSTVEGAPAAGVHAYPTAARPAAPRPAAMDPAATGGRSLPSAYGCAAAEEWIAAHAAPGFQVLCPSDALGHQAMTCANVAGLCPGQRIIRIADACPAAYMNEAHNSWIVTGLAPGRLDPYGSCN